MAIYIKNRLSLDRLLNPSCQPAITMPQSQTKLRDLRPALIFLTGDLIAVPIPLEREEVVLGRALEADIRINDSNILRKHAVIATEKNDDGTEKYYITGNNSRNGVVVNGEKVEKAKLKHGDKISIGKHIIRFELLDEIDREYQRQIHRLISHDDLTGLLSSRSFFSELRREAAQSKLNERPFCVLMMDVDHFKDVNDTYGHLTGSKTLEEIGLCITNALRSGDAASRFGGEEFSAFLLDADRAQAMVAAERLRSIIQNTNFTIIRHGRPSEETHNITISIGISSFPDDSSDPIELVEMADSALYRAKRDGRNRICAYSESASGFDISSLPPRRD